MTSRNTQCERALAGQNGENVDNVKITEITISRGECASIRVQVENVTSDWFTADGVHVSDSRIRPYAKITKDCCAFHRSGDSVLLTDDEKAYVANVYLDKLSVVFPKAGSDDVTVYRDGSWHCVPIMDLVVGDTVLLDPEEH